MFYTNLNSADANAHSDERTIIMIYKLIKEINNCIMLSFKTNKDELTKPFTTLILLLGFHYTTNIMNPFF